ncbi:MAG: asparagine synthase-related protein, partial [Chitinophagaceae bacterium]
LKLPEKIRLLRNITKYTNLNYKQVLVHLLFYNFNYLYVIGTKVRRRLIKRKYLSYRLLQGLKVNTAVYKDINKLQQNELFHTVLPHLLKAEDKNSMYHSVESRLPFIDYKLIETLFSVDNKLKVKDMWTKYLMRKMIENKLPNEIVWRRKKLGFAAPSGIWLNDKGKFMPAIRNSAILKEVLNEIPSTIDKNTMWKLYNIAVWERIFNVKIE